MEIIKNGLEFFIFGYRAALVASGKSENEALEAAFAAARAEFCPGEFGFHTELEEVISELRKK